MHHADMVCDVVAGIQEALQQEKVQTDTLTVVLTPVDHGDNAVQNTQKQLVTQLQKMKLMMQEM